MSTAFGFQQLVELCKQTQETMQSRAVWSVDLALVVRNWLSGWYVVEFEQDGTDRAQYGQATLKKLSTALRETIGRGFSVDNLELMRRFFMTYRNTLPIDSKSETLLRMSGTEIPETASRNSSAFPKPTMIQPASPALITPELIEKLFARFTLGWSHSVILLSIDSLLRCYVLIDLKRDKLTHQDLDQMQMYVNYFDRFVKTEDEFPTIGIVLCRRKNDALVELTLPKDASIFAPKYQLYLPSKEELKQQLEKIEAELGGLANG